MQSLSKEHSIDLIKSQETVLLRSGMRTFNYYEVPTEYAIERIKRSDFGASVWYDSSAEKYRVNIPSFLDMM